MIRIWLIILAWGAMLAGGASAPAAEKAQLLDAMKRAMQYQIDRDAEQARTDWQAAAFWAGVTTAYENTGDRDFYDAARRWARDTNYAVHRFPFHADDIAVGQAYLALYANDRDPRTLEPLKAAIDPYLDRESIPRNELHRSTSQQSDVPFTGRNVWWWCDALFMGPPVFARYAKETGDARFVELMHRLYWDAVEFLYDGESHLFFRDARYRYPRHKSPAGNKVFWSRGNGWVYAGLIRVLDALPGDDPQRGRYLELYRGMTAALIPLQGEDGFWRSSLNEPTWHPEPESSGTAFFCYGMLAGINRGYLDREKHLPAALRAWEGLQKCMRPDGKVAYSQPVGAAPATAPADNAMDYTQGAFLMAASEYYVLKYGPRTGADAGTR